nr:hypothetical protein [Tanacetum cinerariifolium]
MILPSTYIDTIPIPIVSSTIPPSLDYIPASPDYLPAFDTESDPSEDPSSDHIPPLPATLPFLSSTDDSSDNDIPDRPPSPTHGTPFTKTTLSTQRSPTTYGSFRCRVMVLAPGQPIPHVDYSSSDHFALDDSSSSSSLDTFLDSSTYALSDYASSHSSFDHSLPAPSSGMRHSHHLCSLVPSIPRSSAAISARPSHSYFSVSPFCKRSRSPAASVPLSSPIPGALSYARVDLSPSPKRIRNSEFATNLEGYSKERFKPSRHRETDLEMDVDVVRSALRDRGIDARVVVEAVDRDKIETSARGSIEVRFDRDTHPVIADDILEPAQEEGAVKVIAILVISVSSDSSEDSVGTPAGRVILFGTIPTTIPDTTPVITLPTTQTDTTVIPTETPIITHTIPPSPDYTLASPDYSPAFDTESDPSEDPSSGHIPPLPESHHFYHQMMTPQIRSPVIPRHRVMILTPVQPILHGRPYRYHPNGPIHMMTARKRVRPLPVQQLTVRHFVDHSSSEYFSLDDSARDSYSDSSSEASSYFHSDASSDSSSRYSLSDHSSPDLPSTSVVPSHKRHRSPMTTVPALPPVFRALSPIRADLIPLPERVMDSGYLADVETGVRGLVEVRVETITHLTMPVDIPEPAQEGVVEVTYKTLGDLVQRFHDHTEAIPVHRVHVIKGVQREQGHSIVGVASAVTALIERITELERDNRRLRGTASVESLRLVPGGIWATVLRLFLETMPNTLSGASRIREAVNEQIDHRLAGALGARDAARNHEPLMGNGGNGNGNGENRNGGNGNGRNGNGNGNGRGNGYNFGGFMPAR